MSLISLQNSSELGVTILSNRFIDNFMPRANGEFVKVYIYLLRMVSATPSSFSLEHMADSLFCTERDISRALKYWEGEKLIALAYTADQKLSGITLLEPFADTGHRESSASMDTFTGSGNSASASGNTDPGVPSSADYILSLTPDRIRELKQNEEISQLLYITEQYLTKTLTPTEMQKILFFYDELHMSADLIEYLVEYCVSRGRKSMRYIETVALAWAKDGITTVEMARDASSRFSKDYYTILKAMGISGRNPVDNEITYIDTWRKTYGFDLELIQEACSRTVLSTGQPSFQYADKILTDWKKSGVRVLGDIRELDHKRMADKEQNAQARDKRLQKYDTGVSTQGSRPRKGAPNQFHNFEQRDTDYDALMLKQVKEWVGQQP